MNEKSHNLLIRTMTGLVFVVVVLAAMLIGRTIYFVLLLWVAYFCITEFLRLSENRTQKRLGTLYILLCMVAMGIFPVIGIGMTGDALLWRDCPVLAGEWPQGWDIRIAPAFIAVVWANDVFAYLIGVAFGRHKMAPRISPHKSWEGFAGGIIGATVTSALVGRFWAGGDVWLWTAFGIVVALAAVAGDLTESRFKRAARVKDSGRILPGHGGMLDRFDATLGAVPAAFLFFLVTYFLAK
jgi:phosphatidate cytidylyltransferase